MFSRVGPWPPEIRTAWWLRQYCGRSRFPQGAECCADRLSGWVRSSLKLPCYLSGPRADQLLASAILATAAEARLEYRRRKEGLLQLGCSQLCGFSSGTDRLTEATRKYDGCETRLSITRFRFRGTAGRRPCRYKMYRLKSWSFTMSVSALAT